MGTAPVEDPTVTSLASGFAGGWRLGKLLGKGGTAAVYRGEHADGRVGAVKVMHRHLIDEQDWSRRLRREAKVLAAVNHPGLVRLLDIGQMSSGAPFLVTELLEGRSLDDLRHAQGGSLPLSDVLRYAGDVLDVLSHTHEHGIVHRDLKPSNVFLTDTGRIKVLDFGIASSVAIETTVGSTHSETRGILGTPAYMAPEQARGRWDLVDRRADLWAVGAMIFTLCSGEYVHVAVTENERLGLAMSRPARSLASVTSGLPSSLVRVIDRALEYEISQRWQSAVSFRDALNAVLEGREVVFTADGLDDATLRDRATETPAPPAPSRRGVMLAGLGGATLVAAISGFSWLNRKPPAHESITTSSTVVPRPPLSVVSPIMVSPPAGSSSALPTPPPPEPSQGPASESSRPKRAESAGMQRKAAAPARREKPIAPNPAERRKSKPNGQAEAEPDLMDRRE